MSYKLIWTPLFILIVLAFLNILLGFNFGGYSVSDVVSTTTLIDGSTKTYVSEYDFSFGIDEGTGWIAILVGLLTLGAVVGANVLGSGLNDTSSKAVMTIIVFTGLWSFFSVFGWNLITGIATWGVIIWFGLTLMFTVGVIKQIFGGN